MKDEKVEEGTYSSSELGVRGNVIAIAVEQNILFHKTDIFVLK